MLSIQEGMFWLGYCMDFFSFRIVSLLNYILYWNLKTNEMKTEILTILVKNVWYALILSLGLPFLYTTQVAVSAVQQSGHFPL